MLSIRHRIGSTGVVLAALVALGSGAAEAAPQALALVATEGKVALTCEGRTCSVELTSFCLDAGRFSPAPGTAYQLAGNGQIHLTGRGEDGRTLVLDARSHLRFASARRHLAVRASLDRALLDDLGLGDAELEIAENVALLPVPQAGDPDQISDGEAALFAGPLRQLGTQLVDSNSDRIQAARATSRMINLLPPGDRVGWERSENLWQRATAASSDKSLTPAARKRARGAFELCRFVATVGGPTSLRDCLQEQHDGFVDFLNSKYWEAVKTGT